MFGISERHYNCGLRTGHDFLLHERVFVDRSFDSTYKYSFKCQRCGYTYVVFEYRLNTTEKALIANDVNFKLCKGTPSNKDT